MRAIETAPHEFTANYLYNQFGLSPFFACDSAVKEGNGSVVGEFTVAGERWVTKLSYQSSNIVHPGETTPRGTEFRIQTIREYRLKVARHPDEDSVGEQSFTAHLAPRWVGMKGESKSGKVSQIPVPEGFGEGVNVRASGSNIEFERYGLLLRLAFEAVGVSGSYFTEIHPYSNILDAERYVRVHKDESGPIHARTGPISSLAHVLEHDRRGRRKLDQRDDDLHQRNLPGFYHTVTLDSRRIREAWPHHALPKELKHYYAKEALGKPESDPLAHPKVGASYQSSYWDETLHLSDLDQLNEELEETVRSVLLDGEVDLAPIRGNGPYIPDAYFGAHVTEDVEQVTELEVSEIRHEQENVVIRYLADGGFSQVEQECLHTLVTDGGDLSPQTIADKIDRHVDSVRRALKRKSELFEREYGKTALKSDYVAELVHELLIGAQEQYERALSTTAKAIGAKKQGLSESKIQWVAWCERYGVDISNRYDALEIDFGDLDPDYDPDPRFLVREGLRVWKSAGQDPARYRTASVKYNSVRRQVFQLL